MRREGSWQGGLCKGEEEHAWGLKIVRHRVVSYVITEGSPEAANESFTLASLQVVAAISASPYAAATVLCPLMLCVWGKVCGEGRGKGKGGTERGRGAHQAKSESKNVCSA